MQVPCDNIRLLDLVIAQLLTSARQSSNLLVLLIECGVGISELLRSRQVLLPQSWRLEAGEHRSDAYFPRSYICIQYCEHRTRMDDKTTLADFYDDAGISLPPGMGGGVVNASQLGKEIAFIIGAEGAGKYGS